MAAQMGKLAGSVALTFDAQLQEGQYKSVIKDKTRQRGTVTRRARCQPSRRSFRLSVHSSLSVLRLSRLLEVSEAMLAEIMAAEFDPHTQTAKHM